MKSLELLRDPSVLPLTINVVKEQKMDKSDRKKWTDMYTKGGQNQ